MQNINDQEAKFEMLKQAQKTALNVVTRYLYQNYYNDCERLVKVPFIVGLVNHKNANEIPLLIDKLAILNGIKKSYPPGEITINA